MNSIQKKTFLIIFLLIVFYSSAPAQESNNNTSNKEGVTFKVPDDVFAADFRKSGFNGILMLRKDAPSGLFVIYPNDNETIEHLRDRLATFAVPMFIQDKSEVGKLVPKITPIPVHPGDVDKSGSYYLYSTDKTQIQVLFYQHIANGRLFLYGYFANKNVDSKDDVAIKGWADENGQGVKIFEKFWKTIKD